MAKVDDRPEASLNRLERTEPSRAQEAPVAVLRPASVRPGSIPPRGPAAEGLAAWLADIDVGVIEADGAGRVARLNEAAERLTGWSSDDARGVPVERVFRVLPLGGAGADPDYEIGRVTAALDEAARDSMTPEDAADAPLDDGVMAPGVDEGALRKPGVLLGPAIDVVRGVALPAPKIVEASAAAPGADATGLLERRDGSTLAIRHAEGAAGGRREGKPGAPRVVVFREASAPERSRAAHYDALTHLLDRYAIVERIEEALDEHKATGARYALCYIDLDRFRLVNATCGHEAGDDLLQWVATRVHEIVGPNDAAGRIGGDEFALLLAGRSEREAERIARDLQLSLLEFRFGWAEKTFSVGASIGLVVLGPEFERASDVLGAADYACRVAKENGRGRLQIYLDDDQMTRSRRSMQWVASLQRHLAEGKLRLYAQGIHALTPGARGGAHFEVLVRQVDEEGRVNSPVGIIHAAEQSGLIHVIDRYVARQAFRMLGALPPSALRRLETCSINLSGVSLLREGLLDFLVEQLHRAQVPPSKICFEITETAAVANLGEVLWFMQELGAMGCRFAIDDFGSGHASYGYLESLPVDYVKIDGLFVRDLHDNSLHRAIVESVLRIGNTLGIKTVAEQVENENIAALLTSMGVHYAQGWHFSRPQPMVDLCAGLHDAP